MRNPQKEAKHAKGRCCTKQRKTVYKHPIHSVFWGQKSKKDPVPRGNRVKFVKKRDLTFHCDNLGNGAALDHVDGRTGELVADSFLEGRTGENGLPYAC